jgi:hypothetical protein
MRYIGVMTWRLPTKLWNGAAARPSTGPRSVSPLNTCSAPTYDAPTLRTLVHLPCRVEFVVGPA